VGRPGWVKGWVAWGEYWVEEGAEVEKSKFRFVSWVRVCDGRVCCCCKEEVFIGKWAKGSLESDGRQNVCTGNVKVGLLYWEIERHVLWCIGRVRCSSDLEGFLWRDLMSWLVYSMESIALEYPLYSSLNQFHLTKSILYNLSMHCHLLQFGYSGFVHDRVVVASWVAFPTWPEAANNCIFIIPRETKALFFSLFLVHSKLAPLLATSLRLPLFGTSLTSLHYLLSILKPFIHNQMLVSALNIQIRYPFQSTRVYATSWFLRVRRNKKACCAVR